MGSSKIMGAVHQEGLRKMTQPERQALEKELSDLGSQLNPPRRGDNPGDPTESRPDLLQNRPGLLARKRKLEELLNKDDDLSAVGDTQRTRLSQEAKALEGELGKHMLTERERLYRMGQKPQDYETAVQRTVYQQQNHLPKLQRWQEIMRQLYPDDPTMCDVRRIKSL